MNEIDCFLRTEVLHCSRRPFIFIWVFLFHTAEALTSQQSFSSKGPECKAGTEAIKGEREILSLHPFLPSLSSLFLPHLSIPPCFPSITPISQFFLPLLLHPAVHLSILPSTHFIPLPFMSIVALLGSPFHNGGKVMFKSPTTQQRLRMVINETYGQMYTEAEVLMNRKMPTLCYLLKLT